MKTERELLSELRADVAAAQTNVRLMLASVRRMEKHIDRLRQTFRG